MASFLVATPARIERGVGDVIEVPGTTEQELRQAVIDQITGLCNPLPLLRADEVTVSDMAEAWSRPIASTRAALDLQVKDGTMSRRKVLNTRTGRECWAYRVVS